MIKDLFLGCLSQLSIWLLISTQVLISGSWVQAPSNLGGLHLKKKNKKKHLFLNPTDLLRSCRYSVFRLLIWGWKRRQLSTGAHLHWSKFASKSFKSLVLLGCACQADFYSLPHCSIKEKPGRGATRPCAQLVGAYAELTVGAMAGLGDRWAWEDLELERDVW